MDNLNKRGKKLALAVALVVGCFGWNAANASASTVPPPSPHVNTSKPIMRDSTPLVFPHETNAVVNPTANWGRHEMTIRKVAFLMSPHEYQGHKVCVLDSRNGAPLALICEALLGHGRRETFRAYHDDLDLFITVTSELDLNHQG